MKRIDVYDEDLLNLVSKAYNSPKDNIKIWGFRETRKLFIVINPYHGIVPLSIDEYEDILHMVEDLEWSHPVIIVEPKGVKI